MKSGRLRATGDLSMHSIRGGLAAIVSIAWLTACGGSDSFDPGGDVDGDGIRNGDEGDESIDTDGDEFPDYRDLDSDGDGVPDADEAGDDDLSTPPVDTDGDGAPDYVDLDSDGDSIADTDELGAGFEVVDSDGDGAPDVRDTDSDGDGIPDEVEAGDLSLESTPIDTDRDGTADVRDDDSDGDCLPDAVEAGGVPAQPVHSDGDGVPDFRDLDSDGDGLPDGDEDADCDGVVDPGETSSAETDTDGDGTPDLIEVVGGSDPTDPNDNIPADDFYFVLPYLGPGAQGDLDFATGVRQADIFFSVDTTGSFQEEIDAIEAALATTIVPGVAAVVPDAAFGVGRFEDFPLSPFGLAGDKPFELLQAVTTNVTLVGVGLAALAPASGGLDVPESGYEALYQWATGLGFADFGIAPFAPPGIGGVGFREASLPIIIQITDARSHLASEYPFAAHSEADAVAALDALGVRVIGIDSLENVGTALDPRAQLEAMAIATDALIPPDGAGQCATGVGGALRPAVDVGGTLQCPVVFDVLEDGSGLGDLIVDAIAQLTTLGTLDISTRPVGQTVGLRGEVLPPGTTTADFLTAITPVPPPPAGATIDGDVFRGVTPGSTVTFAVEAFNDFVPETVEDQLFAIDIDVLGDLVTVLDVRRVFVIVPRTTVIVD